MEMYQSRKAIDNSLRMGDLEFEIISRGNGRIHSVWIPNRHMDKLKEQTKITCTEVMAGVSNVLQQVLVCIEGDCDISGMCFSFDYSNCIYEVRITDTRDCCSICVSIYCKSEYEAIGGMELC